MALANRFRPSSSLPLLAFAYLASRVPFVYRDGFPDGDQQHIALGILDAVMSGRGFEGLRLYGASFSPGYHLAHFALGPLYRHHPYAVFDVMNWSGILAGLLALVGLYAFVRELRSSAEADAAGILWTFAPGWWELTTFGHPSTIALGLLFPSLACLARGSRAQASPAWTACAAVLYFLTLSVRADFLLAAPAFLLVPVARNRWRTLVPAAIVCGFGVAAFLLLHRIQFPPVEHSTSSSFFGHAMSVRGGTARLAVREAVVFVLGLGVPAMFVGVLSLLLARDRRLWTLTLAATIIPATLWWLQVWGAFRHFLIPGAFLTIAAAALLARTRSPRLAAIAVALCGQAVAFILSPAIEARYPWTFRAEPGVHRWSSQAPLGDWLSSHVAAARGVKREAEDARWIAGSAPESLLVVAPSSFRYEFEVLARSKGRYGYRLLDTPAEGVERVLLESPQGTRRFLAGDPAPLAAALALPDVLSELHATRIFVPSAAVPVMVTYPVSGLIEVSRGEPGPQGNSL